MAKRSKKTATKRAAPEPTPPESNVIQGDDHGKDVIEQTREARGGTGEQERVDLAGDAGTAPPRTDEMQARDKQIEERREFLEERGTSSNDAGRAGNLKKVEAADTSQKQYRGMVTVSGIHGQTHEKISCRIDLPTASGEEYVHYAFFAHHPAANRDPSTITIDPLNQSDPFLRSRFE
jgi:hypothetical protein